VKRFLKSLYLPARRLVLSPFRRRAEPFVPAGPIRSILVLRPDRIGDMVQTTPMLAALKKEFPGSRITVLASAANGAVLDGNPDADRVVLEPPIAESFDLLIDPYWEYDLEWIWIARKVRARYKLGFDIWGRAIFYNLRVPGLLPGLSASEAMLDLCRRGLGRPFPDEKPRIFLLPGQREKGRKLLQEAGAGLGKPLVLLHPGGHYEFKRWPAGNFGKLAAALEREGACEALVTGGPADEPLLREAKNAGARTLAAADLRSWICLLPHAALLICNNSGPMHVACALGVRTLCAVGPEADDYLWRPRGPLHQVLEADPLGSLTVAAMLDRARAVLEEMSGKEA